LGPCRSVSCYKCYDIPVKLKYTLPLAQMVLAFALLWWSNVLDLAARHVCDMPGPSPAFELLTSINAPVALARAFWYFHLPYLWDAGTLVVAVGLFWYWVALNIYSWRQRRTVFMFSWVPVRLAGDLLLIAVGVLWGLACVDEVRSIVHVAPAWSGTGCFGPLVWSMWLPSIVVAGLHLAWSLVLTLFFGGDFFRCVLRKSPLSPRLPQG
jgi:hypothetical protein